MIGFFKPKPLKIVFVLSFIGLILVEANTEEELENDLESEIPVIEGIGDPIKISEENEVLALTSDNFHHVIGTKNAILVEFYAPWCGHCQAFAPEYEAAAKELKKDGIQIAKVDATSEEELGKEFDISGYLTLKLFKKGKYVEDFDGERSSSGIVEYMRMHSDPDYKPPPSAVKVLVKANFTNFIDSEKLSLVEFYAPWCGHCKRLAPEYEGAAQDLRSMNIPLAKVDATEEKDLASEFNIHGYPKLLVFRYDRQYEFKGPRDRRGIVRYMEEMSQPPSSLVNVYQVAKNMMPRADASVFAFFEDENEMFKEFVSSANAMRGECSFSHTFNADLAKKFGLAANSINIVIPEIFHSKYEDKKPAFTKLTASEKEITSWIGSRVIPLVGHRTRSNLVTRYSKRPLLVVYYDVNFTHQHVVATQFVRNKVLPVANSHRDIIFAISSEEEFQDDLKNFGLEDSGEDINVAIFGDKNLKYKMDPEEEFDSDVLEGFVLKFKKGELKPHLKSQPIPKRQEGPVRTLVAETFEKEVIKSDRDVLVEFYAPWCGHCQKLEPVYKKFAKHMVQEYPALLVAKMDAAANDVPPEFPVQGFPTIYLLKADNKNNPISFSGNRTLAGFKNFISEHLDKDKLSEKDEL